MLTKYDRALIYFLLLSVLFTFLGTIWVAHSVGKPDEVVVSANGEVAARFSLQGQSQFKIRGPLGDSEINITNGKVKMVSSSCVQKVCVHKGYIEKPGECIVCAPNGIVVKIVSKSETERLDAISK